MSGGRCCNDIQLTRGSMMHAAWGIADFASFVHHQSSTNNLHKYISSIVLCAYDLVQVQNERV